MAKRYIFAVDVGGTITKMGLFDLNCKILKKSFFHTKDYKGKDSLIKAIIGHFYKIIQSRSIPAGNIKGIGIGIPGLVDRKGVIYELTNIYGWRNVSLSSIIQRRLNIPTFIDNDANLTALGEWRLGSGKGRRNLICVTLGTGVGGGIIIDGKLFHGSKFTGAEIGHIPISEKGEKCNCGGEACLETYVGNSYLSRIAREKLKKGRKSILKKLCKGKLSNLTPLLLSQAAKCGDALAKELWDETGEKIGIALSGLVNVFNPELIIIGGGVSFAGKFIFTSIRRSVKKRVMKAYRKDIKIVPAKFRKDAGLIGAAILVRENVIRSKS